MEGGLIIRVYIAGQYTSDHVFKSLVNMRKGINCAIEVFKRGHSPFCPWLDYLFVLMDDGDITCGDMYEYSMEWLAVCDAVLTVPGWTASKGAKAEVKMAKKLKIAVYHSIDELPEVD